jgi:hypothetical protein
VKIPVNELRGRVMAWQWTGAVLGGGVGASVVPVRRLGVKPGDMKGCKTVDRGYGWSA